MIKLFRERLFSAFYEWLEKSREYMGKWFSQLYNKGERS